MELSLASPESHILTALPAIRSQLSLHSADSTRAIGGACSLAMTPISLPLSILISYPIVQWSYRLPLHLRSPFTKLERHPEPGHIVQSRSLAVCLASSTLPLGEMCWYLAVIQSPKVLVFP